MSSSNIPVNEVSCSKFCEATIKFLREQNDLLKRENEDRKYEGYTLRKAQKPLKTQLDAKTKDFRKLQQEYSNKCENYDYIKRQLAELTIELDALKAKYNDVEFAFKKFDVSSEVVASMIEKQLKFKDNQSKNLGYNSVPPPFNDNYNPPLETNEEEIPAQFGPLPEPASVK